MQRPEFPFKMYPPKGYQNQGEAVEIKDVRDFTEYENQGYTYKPSGGSRRRRRPSRKYKKSKRVFRKKSRATRRR